MKVHGCSREAQRYDASVCAQLVCDAMQRCICSRAQRARFCHRASGVWIGRSGSILSGRGASPFWQDVGPSSRCNHMCRHACGQAMPQ
eukprot:9005464-Lingulodinium_polyedra.AAC.1